MKDNGEKAGEEVVTEVNEKIALLRTAREGDDMAAITSASEALSTSLQKIMEAMQKAQAEEPAADAPKEEAATDAEFTEEKPEEPKGE